MKNYTQIDNLNLYKNKIDGRYYQLTSVGVTPNGCWLINPTMREIVDIDIATGVYVYGDKIYYLGTGAIAATVNYKLEA